MNPKTNVPALPPCRASTVDRSRPYCRTVAQQRRASRRAPRDECPDGARHPLMIMGTPRCVSAPSVLHFPGHEIDNGHEPQDHRQRFGSISSTRSAPNGLAGDQHNAEITAPAERRFVSSTTTCSPAAPITTSWPNLPPAARTSAAALSPRNSTAATSHRTSPRSPVVCGGVGGRGRRTAFPAVVPPGAAPPPELTVFNPAFNLHDPVVATYADGSYIVAWQSVPNDADIQFRVNAGGNDRHRAGHRAGLRQLVSGLCAWPRLQPCRAGLGRGPTSSTSKCSS